MKPVIGISAYPRMVETATGQALLHTSSRFYVESVERAGGVPVILPVLDPDTVEYMLPAVSGTSARDLDPRRPPLVDLDDRLEHGVE